MKPISKKVVEAGLVSKHTLLLMKRWGYMDPEQELPEDGESTSMAQRVHSEIKVSFTKFVDDLDQLLEEKETEDIKETKFSITLTDPFQIIRLYEKYGNYEEFGSPIIIFRDETGRMVFPPSEMPGLGDMFEMMDSKDWYEITEVAPLWSGNTIVAYQVEAEKFR